jgi:Ser/Thr protein kinase RdoA (MazF antagonist)
MEPLAQVLAAYPAVLRSANVVPLGNHGGFSGARLWRLDTIAGSFCLRAGAPAETRAHFQQRHALMARARAPGLTFVPTVLTASDGSSVIEIGPQCWELMEWLRGAADFHSSPTLARLRAAAAALAKVHCAWKGLAERVGAPPAVTRRLEALRRVSSGSSLMFRHPLLESLRGRMGQALGRWLPEVPRLLGEWDGFRCTLQPCLRDVWHDHLLFEGDVLTGLVDYARAGIDSVATDLARMFGSLIGDDDERWREALDAYREQRPLSGEEEQLARILDRTGVIAGLCNWLRWLDERQNIGDNAGAERRMEELLQRVEAW